MDYPARFNGHDKRAPPIPLSEGRACHVRGSEGPNNEVPLLVASSHKRIDWPANGNLARGKL